ncbi:MAG: hypothetical protein K2P93_02250 [Alphaproteobacteria bacterium]|nr:hypothetical protein [Alphaproteobacteria bacterium]
MRTFLLLFCLSLIGCNTIFSERVPCPKTAIVAEFAKSIDFYKTTPVRTEIDSLIPHCTAENNQVAITIRMRLTSLRSSSSMHIPATIKPSYFVAVIDDQGKILSRTDHTVEVTFIENQTTKVSFEHLEERIPFQKGVSLYIGFNLDNSQLEYLKQEREKRSQDQVAQ